MVACVRDEKIQSVIVAGCLDQWSIDTVVLPVEYTAGFVSGVCWAAWRNPDASSTDLNYVIV